jgi:hypothetical protein
MDILKLVEEMYENKKMKNNTLEKSSDLQEDTMVESEMAATFQVSNDREKAIDTKVHEPKDSLEFVKVVVDTLNSGVGFSIAEKKFKMKKLEMRALLKKHNFKYNHLFDVWTDQSEEVLLNKLDEFIKTADITLFEYAKKKKLNYKELRNRLNNLNGTTAETVDSTTTDSEVNSAKASTEISKSDQPSSSIPLEMQPTAEAPAVTKAISKKVTLGDSIIEVPIFIDKDIFHKLNELSYINDTSVSSLVSNIVKDHIKNTMD